MAAKQLGSLQVNTGRWNNRSSLFLFFSVVACQTGQWTHCQKRMSHFLHLHRTSCQVKYGLHVKIQVCLWKKGGWIKVVFVFKESRNGQEVRVYHVHSPFSPPPPPPSFSSPGAACATQTQLPLQGMQFSLCLQFKRTNRACKSHLERRKEKNLQKLKSRFELFFPPFLFWVGALITSSSPHFFRFHHAAKACELWNTAASLSRFDDLYFLSDASHKSGHIQSWSFCLVHVFCLCVLWVSGILPKKF